MRSALPVGSGPHSVHEARRWVVDQVTGIGRPDLADTTELGVSELVTNAMLHAAAPIEVRVRGTRLHPRVEVRDGSPEPPELPTPGRSTADPADLTEDDLLVTVGRGLDIVARCADAWGAEIEDAGKVVWFAPATRMAEIGVTGAVTGMLDRVTRPPLAGTREFRLRCVPVDALRTFQRHYQELQREVRLLALAHEADYPLAKTLSDLFGSMQRELRAGLHLGGSDRLRARSDGTVDLTVRTTPDTADAMGRFVELLDFADEFCRRERMLSLARTPEQRAFQTWFLTEFTHQRAGREPSPWQEPPASGLRAHA
ncbi:ATP-binding protein [Nocardioides aestuarii]|uniref:ATP-binding protein n=1 Tax=Nocardioides aestuarii TaxID=252231 RepID=A0ABW4TLD1_9ACTN